MTRLRPIHQTKGDPTPAIDQWLKWPLIVLLVLFVLALFWAREQGETLLLGLRLLEFGAALVVLLVAAYGGRAYQNKRRLAAREVAHAAAADRFLESGTPAPSLRCSRVASMTGSKIPCGWKTGL